MVSTRWDDCFVTDPVESGVETTMRPLRDTLSQLRLRELLIEVQDRVEQIVRATPFGTPAQQPSP